FIVVYDPVPEPVVPILNFPVETDTLALCGTGAMTVITIDAIENENIPSSPYTWQWTVGGAGTFQSGQNPGVIQINEEGWVTITVEFELDEDPCSEDEQIYQATDSIYVTLLDIPDVSVSLTGPAALCQGDTVWLEIITDSETFALGTLSQGFISGDSIGTTGPGNYIVEVSETNEFGCSASASASLTIQSLVTPQIFSEPAEAVICPGDSVLLTTDALGDITWLGPSGFAGQDSALYVQESGEYFVEVQFYPGCGLVSNTLQVAEYASPFLSASTAAICEGDSVTITVVSTAGSDITWLPPLSGNDPSQTIAEPGDYTVEVTSCGITTQSTISVGLNTTEFFAEQVGGENTCMGDSILIAATPGMSDYVWNGGDVTDSLIWVFAGGNYQAAAVDSFGCDVLSNIVTVEFETVPGAPVFEFDPTCFGDSITISVASDFTLDWLAGEEGPAVPGGSEVLIAPFVSDTVLYAVLSTEWCIGPVGEIEIAPKPLPESPIPATDAPVCTGTSFTLSVLNPEEGAVYLWVREDGAQFTGAEVSVFAQSTASGGLFEVIPELDGCRKDTAEVFVDLIETRAVELPADTAVCEQSLFTLGADTIFAEYTWQDGSSDSLFTPEQSGDFTLTVVDFNGCITSDIINVELVDCAVTIPNIFTPNGDGRNDLWVISIAQPLYFRISVYNRWGRLVYESDSVGRWWDGNHYQSGEPCPDGVYFYVAEIQSFEDVAYNLAGNLTLTREQRNR
ncbi:MAG: gliding motility-associated C-terminal domain-containing protein, partial [Cryomorphaceae bacterium]